MWKSRKEEQVISLRERAEPTGATERFPFLRNNLKFFMGAALGLACLVAYIYVQRLLELRKPEVTLTTVQRGDIIETLASSGVILAKEEEQVRSKVISTVKALYVSDGDLVKKGELLIELDDAAVKTEIQAMEMQVEQAKAGKQRLSSNQSTISQAKANVKQAKLVLDEAKRELENTKKLYEAKAIARELFHQAELNVEKAKIGYESAVSQLKFAQSASSSSEANAAELSISQAQTKLDEAQKKLNDLKLYAPLSGYVSFGGTQEMFSPYAAASAGPLKIGQSVTMGQTLMTLTNPDKLSIRCLVDEIEADKVKEGMPATLKADGKPGKEFQGKVVKKLPGIVKKEGLSMIAIQVDILDEGTGIRPGSSADVDIVTQFKKNVLFIPKSSLKDTKGDTVAYVVEKHSPPKAYMRKLKTGVETASVVEVKGGLQEGEKIVFQSPLVVFDGQKVRIKEF